MLNIGYTLSCTQQTFNIDIHSNELIREGFMKIIRNKEEYYKKIYIDGMTLNGELVDMDRKFIEVDARDNDNIIVLCRLISEVGIHPHNPNEGDNNKQPCKPGKEDNNSECKSGKGSKNSSTEIKVDDNPPPLPISSIVNEISLTYYTETDNAEALIFGEKFFNREKDNIEILLIDDNETKTDKKINDFKIFFKKGGKHFIKLSFKKLLNNFSYMFCSCYNLYEFKGHLDVSQGTDFGWMFGGCSTLRNLSFLEDWDMRNAKNIRCMFFGCSSLTSLEKLSKWDTKNVENFDTVFGGCSSLLSLKGLENWDVSKGEDFGTMFYGGMFSGCGKIRNLNYLRDWNVSKGKNFEWMFMGCTSLDDVNGIREWNVDNGISFFEMFKDCPSIEIGNIPMNLRGKKDILNGQQ